MSADSIRLLQQEAKRIEEQIATLDEQLKERKGALIIVQQKILDEAGLPIQAIACAIQEYIREFHNPVLMSISDLRERILRRLTTHEIPSASITTAIKLLEDKGEDISYVRGGHIAYTP